MIHSLYLQTLTEFSQLLLKADHIVLFLLLLLFLYIFIFFCLIPLLAFKRDTSAFFSGWSGDYNMHLFLVPIFKVKLS